MNHRAPGWLTQSAKDLTLGFSSGHNLKVVGSSPVPHSALSSESACDSLLLPQPLPLSNQSITQYFSPLSYTK